MTNKSDHINDTKELFKNLGIKKSALSSAQRIF